MKHTNTIIIVLIQLLTISNATITTKCLSKSDNAFEFIQCSFCETPQYVYMANARTGTNVCNTSPDAYTISKALIDFLTVQGHFWRVEIDALNCMKHLIQYMPVRDALLLFGDNGYDFAGFLAEHIQLSLLVRYDGPSWIRSIPQDIFQDYVLPYAFFNEKRDLKFRWRPRFYQIFYPIVSNANSTTQAMHLLSEAIPLAAASGVLEYNDTSVPGNVIRWKSETSPMRLSPENVIELGGGSCTISVFTHYSIVSLI